MNRQAWRDFFITVFFLFVAFLVVIGFAAWNTGNNLLYLILSAMLAFLIAANLIGRVSLAGVAVQLRFPDHIYAGESASISVTLLNHKRWLPSYSVLVEALSEPQEVRDGATGRRGDRAAEKDESAPTA